MTRKQLIRRPIRDVIASFPTHVALDGAMFGLEGFIYVQPGAVGYWQAHRSITTLEAADDLLARCFSARKPTDAEREAAAIGSLVGWEVPGADPLNHA